MNTGVYTITCTANNKIYTGSVGSINDKTRTFNRRKSEHFRKLRKNKHENIYLQASFNKYGEENIIFDILEEQLPQFCISSEIFWINMLGTTDRKLGYNMSFPLENGGFVHSIETRKKISEGNKGKKRSKEWIENLKEHNIKNGFPKPLNKERIIGTYSRMSSLTKEKVMEIYNYYYSKDPKERNQTELSRIFGISVFKINCIVHKRTFKEWFKEEKLL